MNTDTIPTSTHIPRLGTICCLLSATFYSAANICLRQLAEIEADPAWVVCLKETTAVLLVGPWLLWQACRIVRCSCRPRAVLVLFVAALAVQLVGNLGVQWAYGVVGLVVSLPMVFGALLIGSALIGVTVFRELLTMRSIAAVAVVIASVVLLSVGATGQNMASAHSDGLLLTSWAIAAAGLGGAVYAGMGAALRYAATARMPIPVTIVLVCRYRHTFTGNPFSYSRRT